MLQYMMLQYAYAMMLIFLLNCLNFSKLLKLHQTEGRINVL